MDDARRRRAAVVKTTEKAAFGITEWELSNGVKVVLKPTTFKQDEIVFRATSPGGTSLASDADYVAAATAGAGRSSRGGLGQFSAIDLRKVLTGKVASVRPAIGELEEGLTGSALAEGPRDAVPADLPDRSRSRAPTRTIFGVADDADEGDARQPGGEPGVRLQRGAPVRRSTRTTSARAR